MQSGQFFSVGQLQPFSIVMDYPGMEMVEFEVVTTGPQRVLSAKQGSVAVVVENSCAWVKLLSTRKTNGR